MEDGQQHRAVAPAGAAEADEARAFPHGDGIAEAETAELAAAPGAGGSYDGAHNAAAPVPARLLAPALAPGIGGDPSASLSGPFGSSEPSSAFSRTGAGFLGSLARPFGALNAVLIAVCCFALVGVVYSLVVLTGADWTRGAQVAAYAAFALALLALAVGALRVYAVWRTGTEQGRQATSSASASSASSASSAVPLSSPPSVPSVVIPSGSRSPRRAVGVLALALLLGVSLAGTGAAGMEVAPGLHRAQARVLEQSGRYEAAISEYALAGDTTLTAPDTARTYDEWAASLLRQKQYAAALSRYLLVTSTYPGTGSPYHQAEAGVFATYTAWIAANGAGVPYPSAIAYIQTYMASAACDAACQRSAKAILPQAAYQFGTQLIAAGQYDAAVKQLATVKAQYPQSRYAVLTHTAAAVAYLDLGKQQLPTSCGDAVTSYQTLAKDYADTPQGATAKQALAAPQPVTGTISNVPANPTPTIYLSRSADPVSYYFSNDFHASVDAQSGAFHFDSLPIGSYYLSAVRDTGAGTQTIWWNASDGSIYTVQVSPLCGAHLGSFPFQ